MSMKRKLRWLWWTTLWVAWWATKTLADAAIAAWTLWATWLTAISDYLTWKNNAKKVFDKWMDIAQNVNSWIDKWLSNLALDEEDKENILNWIKWWEISAAIVPLATWVAWWIKGATKLATKQAAKNWAKSTQLIDNMITKWWKIESAPKVLNTAKSRAEATMRKNLPALEREAAEAEKSARTQSLEDMFKERKSQQNW